MATVTKKDIVIQLSDKLGITQNQSIAAVEAMIEIISNSLCAGDNVALRTFGTFEVKVSKAKLGRNPNQPEVAVPIPDRRVIRFKPGIELKQKVAALPVK